MISKPACTIGGRKPELVAVGVLLGVGFIVCIVPNSLSVP
jgi:hypothetical protein